MRILILLFICFTICACGDKSTTDKFTGGEYFDLKGFFEKESLRLNRLHIPVVKTVSRNHNSETKKVQVNWENELALFIESDINKPAWKNSYRKVSNGSSIEYTALEDNLKSRKIRIIRIADRVKSIHITNRTANLLYTSTEDLAYLPDSVYIIKKEQSVKMLGTNQYVITGRLR
ncbi:MAG TPA: hypothetical protein VGD22_19490 [Sphingobacteriaceae bacterium]